jgi:predicted amidophosphoribosyltransferase
MAQTLCIKCGSELKPSSHCQLCQEPLIFACTSCGYITEEKVHLSKFGAFLNSSKINVGKIVK